MNFGLNSPTSNYNLNPINYINNLNSQLSSPLPINNNGSFNNLINTKKGNIRKTKVSFNNSISQDVNGIIDLNGNSKPNISNGYNQNQNPLTGMNQNIITPQGQVRIPQYQGQYPQIGMNPNMIQLGQVQMQQK
jgi:hypothetical protein